MNFPRIYAHIEQGSETLIITSVLLSWSQKVPPPNRSLECRSEGSPRRTFCSGPPGSPGPHNFKIIGIGLAWQV